MPRLVLRCAAPGPTLAAAADGVRLFTHRERGAAGAARSYGLERAASSISDVPSRHARRHVSKTTRLFYLDP